MSEKASEEQGSWVKSYPTLISKNELRGKKLGIFADHPPEPCTKKGMFNLLVFDADTDTSKRYSVLVTAQDIQKIINIVSDTTKEQPRRFTFDSTQPWAEVKPYEGT